MVRWRALADLAQVQAELRLRVALAYGRSFVAWRRWLGGHARELAGAAAATGARRSVEVQEACRLDRDTTRRARSRFRGTGDGPLAARRVLTERVEVRQAH